MPIHKMWKGIALQVLLYRKKYYLHEGELEHYARQMHCRQHLTMLHTKDFITRHYYYHII